MNRFRPLVSFTFILTCGCGGLSHSKAKYLIEHASEFTDPKEEVLWAGRGVIVSELDPLYPALQSLGLIVISETERGISGNPFPVMKAVIKLNHVDAPREWRRVSEDGCCIKWAVPLANRIVTNIIGIRGIRETTTEVQFDWKWRLTQYGESVLGQRFEIERRHSDLLDQLNKIREAKEQYERSHRVLLVGQDTLLSLISKAIGDDYEHRFHEQLVNDSNTYHSVATLYKFDTGWQFGQEGRRNLHESLSKAEDSH
jgi:hypothetical protein